MAEKFQIGIIIIGGVVLLISAGIYGAVKLLLKELKEFIECYKNAYSDKKITSDEAILLVDELKDVITQGFTVWEIIKKVIPGIKSKIKKLTEKK